MPVAQGLPAGLAASYEVKALEPERRVADSAGYGGGVFVAWVVRVGDLEAPDGRRFSPFRPASKQLAALEPDFVFDAPLASASPHCGWGPEQQQADGDVMRAEVKEDCRCAADG